MSCLQIPLRYLTVTIFKGLWKSAFRLRTGIGIDLAFIIFAQSLYIFILHWSGSVMEFETYGSSTRFSVP